MLSFSAVRLRTASAVLFDFRHAFPWLSRQWLLPALTRLEILCGVLRLISQLFADCEPCFLFVQDGGAQGHQRKKNKVAR